MTARAFLAHQILELSKKYNLTLVANLQGQDDLFDWLPGSVKVVDIPIQRNIHLFHDLRALVLLIIFFYKSRFLLVHSVSPKAGLLAMLASWTVRVPVRLHTFTGQVWVTRQGIARTLLRSIDRLISSLTTTVLVDSHSQRDFLLGNQVVTPSGSIVLGAGSISGVDATRFKNDPKARKKIRKTLDVRDTTIVLLFLGRLKKEKGIFELTEAFSRIHGEFPDTGLWLVGPDEEQVQSKLDDLEGICLIPFTNVPEHYMAAADIFCLPSYREGFGSVIIEAAACGLPSIGSNIYGLSDAIVDGETGLLVRAGSVDELEGAMKQLITQRTERLKIGKAAQDRAITDFSQNHVTDQVVELYQQLLEEIETTNRSEENEAGI
jgi:glycosyltransferase involved in cell wall biosynthesis